MFDREIIIKKMDELKNKKFGRTCIDCNNGEYQLVLLTRECVDDLGLMELLGKWRKDNESWFQAIFPVTLKGTQKWFLDGLINKKDRLLFIIRHSGSYIGHVGLFRFNFDNMVCEIDNILRGESARPGIIGDAILHMMKWGREELGIKNYALQTFSNNTRALNLYNRLGFKEVRREPLVMVENGDRKEWVHPEGAYKKNEIDRFNIHMELIL